MGRFMVTELSRRRERHWKGGTIDWGGTKWIYSCRRLGTLRWKNELGIFMQEATYSLVEAEDSVVYKQAVAIIELCASHSCTRQP